MRLVPYSSRCGFSALLIARRAYVSPSGLHLAPKASKQTKGSKYADLKVKIAPTAKHLTAQDTNRAAMEACVSNDRPLDPPPSPVALFRRKEMGGRKVDGKSVVDANKRWSLLSDLQKQEVVDEYNKLRALDLPTFLAQLPRSVITAINRRRASIGKKRICVGKQARGKRAVPYPYQRFLREFWATQSFGNDMIVGSKQASLQWRALSAAERERYRTAYTEHRNAVQEHHARYPKKPGKGKYRSLERKLPFIIRSYNRFVRDYCANRAGTDTRMGGCRGAVLVEASARWRSMSAAEKEPYTSAFHAEIEACRRYRDQYTPFGRRRLNAGLKRPSNPFLRFMKDFRLARESTTFREPQKDICKEGAIRWQSMSDAEKEPYLSAYRAEREAYLQSVA